MTRTKQNLLRSDTSEKSINQKSGGKVMNKNKLYTVNAINNSTKSTTRIEGGFFFNTKKVEAPPLNDTNLHDLLNLWISNPTHMKNEEKEYIIGKTPIIKLKNKVVYRGISKSDDMLAILCIKNIQQIQSYNYLTSFSKSKLVANSFANSLAKSKAKIIVCMHLGECSVKAYDIGNYKSKLRSSLKQKIENEQEILFAPMSMRVKNIMIIEGITEVHVDYIPPVG